MSVLILARVIQGLGAGGMLVLVQAAVADVLPVRDRAPVMSLIGAVFGVAAIGGPAARRLAGRGARLALDLLDQPAGRRTRPGRGLVAAAAPADRCGIRRWRAGDLLPVGLFRRRTFTLVAVADWCSAPRCSVGRLPADLSPAGPRPQPGDRGVLDADAGGRARDRHADLGPGGRAHRRAPPVPDHRRRPRGGALAWLAVLGPEPSSARVGVGFALLGLGIGCAWEVLVIMVQNAVDTTGSARRPP